MFRLRLKVDLTAEQLARFLRVVTLFVVWFIN
jgi:hypothetical protein